MNGTSPLHKLVQVILERGVRYHPWLTSPAAINRGWCSVFAILGRRLVGGTLLATNGHVILRGKDGRYYDAERPGGVSNWKSLPYFKFRKDECNLGPVTQEAAFDGWGCEIPLENPPFHWLKDIHQSPAESLRRGLEDLSCRPMEGGEEPIMKETFTAVRVWFEGPDLHIETKEKGILVFHNAYVIDPAPEVPRVVEEKEPFTFTCVDPIPESVKEKLHAWYREVLRP